MAGSQDPSKVKKRKEQPDSIPDAAPTKKHKKDGSKKKRKERKHQTAAGENDGEFTIVKTSLVVSVPPIFSNNMRAGVEEMLDSMVMRYIPALKGVVVSHSNLEFDDTKATIKADCPYAVSKVSLDAMVWSPTLRMKLRGKISLCSPDHISLLVHRTFNVSIPRHHIPTENYAFEYGPAENDPEFALEASTEQNDEAVEGDNVTKQSAEGGGKWIHKIIDEPLGGQDGILEFTVIGMTIANEMLSLTGSLQDDPFSPDHVPQAQSPTQQGEDDEPELDEKPIDRTREFDSDEEQDSDHPVLSEDEDAVPPPVDTKGSKKTKKETTKKRKVDTEEPDVISSGKKKKHKKKEKEQTV